MRHGYACRLYAFFFSFAQWDTANNLSCNTKNALNNRSKVNFKNAKHISNEHERWIYWIEAVFCSSCSKIMRSTHVQIFISPAFVGVHSASSFRLHCFYPPNNLIQLPFPVLPLYRFVNWIFRCYIISTSIFLAFLCTLFLFHFLIKSKFHC